MVVPSANTGRDIGDDAGDDASPPSFFSNARETRAALILFMASRTRLPETVVNGFSHLKVVAGPAVTVEGIVTPLARENSAARHHATIPPPFSRPHATRLENATWPHSTVDELRFAGDLTAGESLSSLGSLFRLDVGSLDFETRVFGVLCEIG
ncbi:hypothetical protein DEO72_LG4g43 [Vigna unguiculata]|uniref:Uncharacterized protein n=1 Tax=Vigna unguiculata TaxID=3917 RepID=A0A4D6LLA8_VIGUN|nr:hypothetical protein DEO72_LG4g43 [Vigna unguiculata]